jgi:cyclohexanone monooxygenase
VCQRTPPTVSPRNNGPVDPEWAKTLEPGWQRRRGRNFESILQGYPQTEDLVGDDWTKNFASLYGPDILAGGETRLRMQQMADFELMERLRARVASIVQDPRTAELLKPYYDYRCKRPCFSDEYLQAFNRPNVTLVDTKGYGVEAIIEHSLVVDGTSYEVDCIIFATGFQVGLTPFEQVGCEVVGRGGLSLRTEWARKLRSVHGMCIHDFPNLFVVGNANHSTITSNVLFTGEEQARHAAALVGECLARNAEAMDVREEAEEIWSQRMAEKAVDRSSFEAECTPSYYNNEGYPTEGSTLLTRRYGGGIEYFDLIEDWRAKAIDRDVEFISRDDEPHRLAAAGEVPALP